MADKNIKPKKNPIIKTLQWVAVATVSILLILYFVVVDTRGGQKTPVVGTVDGTPIYYTRESAFGKAYLQLTENYKSFGIAIDNTMIRYIEETAFRNAVATILIDNLARKNITVSDKFIVDAMKSQFVDSNGIYNSVAYDSFVKNSSTSEKLKIQKEIANSIMIRTIQSELFTDIKLNSLEMEDEFKKFGTRKKVEIAYLDITDKVNNADITEVMLTEFFNKNKTNFVQANVSYITTKSGGSADAIYKDLSKNQKNINEYFETVAKEKSEDITTKDKGGNVGYITRFEMPSRQISDGVFKSKAGTLLKPIVVDEIYYIILVKDIKVPENAQNIPANVVRAEYFEKNKNAIAQEIKAEGIKILEDALVNAKSTKDINVNGVTYYTTEPFYYGQGRLTDTKNGLIPGSDSDAFYQTAFSTDVNNLSKVVDLGNGLAVIKVLSHEKPDMQKLYSLEAYQRAATKRSLEERRVARIEENWVDIAMSKSRIKKNDKFF